MSLGELLELGWGEGGSCGSGSPGGFQVGCGVATRVQQYLRHSQHCSRCSQEGAGLAQEGVVAHGWTLGQWQSVHGTPKIHPTTSTLHLSIQMQLWLSAVLMICLGHHQGMFFPGNDCKKFLLPAQNPTIGSISSPCIPSIHKRS